jgi:hypothetical protein
MRHNVRVYYPRPLRCSKCCKFQHTRKRCPEREMACRNCNADAHPGIQCPLNSKYCRNCQTNDHTTYDRDCPTLAMETQIVKTKVDQNISYGQARAIWQGEVKKAEESYTATFFERIRNRIELANIEKTQQMGQQEEELTKMYHEQCSILHNLIEERMRQQQQLDQLMVMREKMGIVYTPPAALANELKKAKETTNKTTPTTQQITTTQQVRKTTTTQPTATTSTAANQPINPNQSVFTFAAPPTGPKTRSKTKEATKMSTEATSSEEDMQTIKMVKRRKHLGTNKLSSYLITPENWRNLQPGLQYQVVQMIKETDTTRYSLVIENNEVMIRAHKDEQEKTNASALQRKLKKNRPYSRSRGNGSRPTPTELRQPNRRYGGGGRTLMDYTRKDPLPTTSKQTKDTNTNNSTLIPIIQEHNRKNNNIHDSTPLNRLYQLENDTSAKESMANNPTSGNSGTGNPTIVSEENWEEK